MVRLLAIGTSGYDQVGAVIDHSMGFAVAAERNLSAPVEHCPAWTIADLVRHLIDVQWFWATIVAERLAAPPEEDRRPAPAEEAQLLSTFRAGADRLGQVLRAADADARVWTWAPAQQDVAFVVRHQVQEAAVHHWDAANAIGGQLTIAPAVAADAVTEFLTFSLSSDADPADPVRPALNGRFALRCTDSDAGWTIADGSSAGTVAFETRADAAAPTLTASASELILWLYGRVDVANHEVPDPLLGRFRALCFTD